MALIRWFIAAIILCCNAGVALSQAVDEAELNRLADQVARLQNQITQQTTRLQQADASVKAARDAKYDAKSRLRSAQRDHRYALDRSISAMSASDYLAGSRGAIESLRAQLVAAEPEERSILQAQIQALQRQLDAESQRYGGESNRRLAEIDRTSQSEANAEEALIAAQERLKAEQDLRASVRHELERLQTELGRAQEALAVESDKVAPAWVQDVRVIDDGELIYHARWSADDGVKDGIRAKIDELERQRQALIDLRVRIMTDVEKYGRESNAAYGEIKLLIDEKLYNDVAVIVGDKLWSFGQITLLFTSGVGVVNAGYSAAAATGSLASRTALSAAARAASAKAATQVSFLGLPRFMSWPTYATRATTALRITSQAWSYERALENSWRFTEGAAAAVRAFQVGQSGYKLSTGSFFVDSLKERHTDPDFRRARSVLRRAVDNIVDFPETNNEFQFRHEMRRRYEQQSIAIMTRAYTEVQNQILETESDFWHRIYIGYAWTSRAEISGALDEAALMYMRAVQNGYSALIDAASKEVEDIDAAIAEKDARLSELRDELAGPDVRKLEIVKNERLRVRDDGAAEISIVFSQALVDAPDVKIGAGPAVAFEFYSQPGDGLPLPDVDGAVRAEMTGQSKTWSGRFPLRPLRKFVDSDSPLPIEISGRDAAGRMFDANPRTAARRRAGVTSWYYNEPDFETSVLGGGGPDKWHELNAVFQGGTSYVFVIDASGSMEENDRMAQVKRSARSFLANMSDRDEVAVIAFFDCYDIRVLQGFTRERQDVLAVVDGIVPTSDTPLAGAIMRGGDFLLTRGHYEDKALIVLTDGAESCDGDPVAAAALFRNQMSVVQDLGGADNSAEPRSQTNPEEEPSAEPEPEEVPEARVEARPDDREAWTVQQTRGATLPSISLTRTRFYEWETGDNCAAQVTRETYFAYYGQAWNPDGSANQGFGVNRRASKSDTLDFALCSNGQADMDGIRSRWAQLEGTDYNTARADAEARAMRALRP